MKAFPNSRALLAAILAIYAGIAFYNFQQYGIKIVNDSPRYLEYAANLEHGFYVDPHNFWYIGYAGYILFIRIFGGDAQSIISGQYLLSFLAVAALYHTSLNLWKNPASAFFASFLFILFIDIMQWTSYVLAESVFTSFICFSLYFLSMIYRGKRNVPILAFTIVLVLFTSLIKPTGFALFGAVLLVITHYSVKGLKSVLWRNVARITIVLLLLIMANKMLTTFLIMENYEKGEVIYGITTIPWRPEFRTLIIAPPENIVIPDSTSAPLMQILTFIFHHPLYWIRLFTAKVFFLLGHVRPYWSVTHNFFSLAVLLPAYICFIQGVRMTKVDRAATFSLIYIGLHILSTGITSTDWDGRFLIPILPVVFLFAGYGLYFQFIRKTKLFQTIDFPGAGGSNS